MFDFGFSPGINISRSNHDRLGGGYFPRFDVLAQSHICNAQLLCGLASGIRNHSFAYSNDCLGGCQGLPLCSSVPSVVKILFRSPDEFPQHFSQLNHLDMPRTLLPIVPPAHNRIAAGRLVPMP